MKVLKVALWGLNKKGRWVKRKTVNYTYPFKANRSDVAKPYETKYQMAHGFFPAGVHPNDYRVIPKMLNVIKKVMVGYQDDFFYHDCVSLFEYGKDCVWKVKPTGTHMFKIGGEYADSAAKDTALLLYDYDKDRACSYYRIQGDEMRKITYEKGRDLLSALPILDERALA